MIEYDDLILITYTTSPEASARGYEAWLRTDDNPTFNRTPGIAHYANWKVVENIGAPLPFTYFDLLGISAPDALEAVWFDRTLDQFRAGWVARWGYGVQPSRDENRYASRAVRAGGERRSRTRYLIATAWRGHPGEIAPGAQRWTVLEALRKHWAAGRAPAGEPWRQPAAESNPLGWVAFDLRYVDEPRPLNATANGIVFSAECIAAPDRHG